MGRRKKRERGRKGGGAGEVRGRKEVQEQERRTNKIGTNYNKNIKTGGIGGRKRRERKRKEGAEAREL